MAIFLAGKAVCYRILAFFCYGKLHFKCESASDKASSEAPPIPDNLLPYLENHTAKP